MGKSRKSTTTENREMPAFQREFLTGTVLPFAENIAETPFVPYEGQLTAGVSPLAMGTEALYNRVADVSAMTPEDFAARTAANLNPYQSQVIDATLNRLRREEDIARTREAAEVTRAGAFGNERRGVFEAEREAARDVNRDQLVANLMAQGYNQAQAQAMAQIQAQQAAALAGAGGLTELGRLQQVTEQGALEAAYNEFLRGQQYPLTQLGALATAGGVIPGGYGTTTTVAPRQGGGLSGTLGAIGSLGQAGATFGLFGPQAQIAALGASDRRLKKNIKPLAEVGDVKYYTWEWNDVAKAAGFGSQPTSGVIADELKDIHPDLVIRGDDGFLRVDYAGLAKRQELQPA